MKLNILILALSLSSISILHAAERNLCDDLVDSGTSSAGHVKKCLDDPKFGPSEHYKEQAIANQAKIKVEKAKVENVKVNEDNLIIKKFSKEELFEAGFGKPFFAIRGDYRNRKYKPKTITEGDALCIYLGYEKSLKSVISEEIWENKPTKDKGALKVDNQGLVIPLSKNIFTGSLSIDSPEIYRDEDKMYTVRPFREITCLKRKDKEVEGSTAALKKICEDIILLNEDSSVPDATTGINNGSRATTGKANTNSGTTNGYVRPNDEDDSQSK